jgi:hypothetical protein
VQLLHLRRAAALCKDDVDLEPVADLWGCGATASDHAEWKEK